jgi:hypothetical protein
VVWYYSIVRTEYEPVRTEYELQFTIPDDYHHIMIPSPSQTRTVGQPPDSDSAISKLRSHYWLVLAIIVSQ